MARTCANCGYVNESGDETAANCPNCGTPYAIPVSGPATYAPPPPPPPIYQADGARWLSKHKKLLLIGLGSVAVLVVLIAGGVVAFAASQEHATVAATATATATVTPVTDQKITLQSY